MLYNPQQWPIIGHDWAVDQLTRALNAGRQRHAYLLSGPPSIGKTTFARSLAMALNCEAPEGRPCGQCRPCKLISAGKHPDFHILEADKVGGSLKIEQIRELQHTVSMRPFEARYRVAILRRYQEAADPASNAFLKTLEEPPKNVVLILCTDSIHSILPTILSRCQHYPLHPLRLSEVATALFKHFEVPEPKAELLAHLSGGRMGWAIQAAQDETVLAKRKDYLDLLENLLTCNRRERFAALEEFHEKKSDALELMQVWISYWRDVLLVSQGSQAYLTNWDRQEKIGYLARTYPIETLKQTLASTRRILHQLGYNVNVRLQLEALMLDYPFVKSSKKS